MFRPNRVSLHYVSPDRSECAIPPLALALAESFPIEQFFRQCSAPIRYLARRRCVLCSSAQQQRSAPLAIFPASFELTLFAEECSPRLGFVSQSEAPCEQPRLSGQD